MEITNIMNRIAIIGWLNIVTYIIFIRLISYKENNLKKTIIITIVSLLEAGIRLALEEYIPTAIMIVIIYGIHSIIIAKVTKNKYQYSFVITFISLTLAYLVYIISILLSGIILKSLIPDIEEDNIFILISGIMIESLILYKIFTVRRLKNGISFLKNKEKIYNIGIIGFSFIIIMILIYSKMDIDNNSIVNTCFILISTIELICLIVWLSKRITKYYKQKLKEQTIEELENEIKEKDKLIDKILKENNEIATINHKYSSRIASLERVSAKILSKPEIIQSFNSEFAEEFGEMKKQIEKLSLEYSTEVTETIKHKNILPKTYIFGIDSIIEHMNAEANKNNITFNVVINGNIHYMVENVIKQSKLETLLGDHIKDAIIAIDNSNNKNKKILVIIGIVDDCYEISIYDTGIAFEIETLLKLGTQAVTTHKDKGGSGIGFMTTFETLKETKASLIIEEIKPINDTDYTKAVKIKFDGKYEYRIYSYRADEIKQLDKDNRIIIEKI